MANGVLLPNGQQQFFDLDGSPLAGGLVHTYVPSTTTPKTTWVDQGETTANTNPVVLDSLGRCIMWGSGTYRQYVTDAVGNLIWDAITSDGGLSSVQGDIDTLNSEVDQLQTDVTDLQTTVNKTPGWLKKTRLPTNVYLAVATDSGTMFNSGLAGGTLVVTLPNTSVLDTGWYCGFFRETNDIIVNVDGNHSELIYFASGSATSISMAPQNGEIMILSFDGTNFFVVSASPDTWQTLGAQRWHIQEFNGPASTSFLIPATQIKYRQIGGGAGGASGTATQGGGAGGGGAYTEGILSGLTIGGSLLLVIGGGGAGGAAGGNDGIVGGPTTIGTVSTTFSTAGGGGHGAINGAGGFGGFAAGGDVNINGNQGAPGFGPTPGVMGGAGALGSAGAGGIGTGAAPTSTAAQAGQPGKTILEWFA